MAEQELGEICARYAAIPVAVLSARYGFVVEVSTNETLLVIRSSPDPAGRYQAAVSEALAKVGVGPRIHEVVTKPTGTWTVAERVVPGTPISGRSVSDSALASLLVPLRTAKAPLSTMPSLATWLQDRLEDDALSDLAPGRSVAPKSERAEALDLLADLTTAPLDGLCHGDASAGNVLIAADGRLVFIDPRGVRGEVAYDVAVAAMKTTPPAKHESRAADLARLIDVDTDRVAAWLTIANVARV